MIAAPTTVTEERSAQMLFSEPYLPTGLGFLVKKGTELPDLAALKGKAIAVNNGSSSDKWLTAHEAEHGYAIQRYNKSADAVQAIMVGRADAMIADTPAARAWARQSASWAANTWMPEPQKPSTPWQALLTISSFEASAGPSSATSIASVSPSRPGSGWLWLWIAIPAAAAPSRNSTRARA